ncbi:MAG: hypothetical protein HZB38_14255 [Planctomycetes bacterium]|nr:hypothetical protein [Planctomycetota bacterium]
MLSTPTIAAEPGSAADAANVRLRAALAMHLHPRDGSAYWLERQAVAGFDIRSEIRTIDDLLRLGTTSPAELTTRPLLDFVPRCLHQSRNDWIIAQTGGTTGNPMWTAYSQDEFQAAFVAPFVAAAEHVRFPRGGAWLYAGPSGPHIIGRAARRLAKACDSPEPFSVDFDPRWARKMPAGSFGAERYVRHVVEQAMAVIESQYIEVLFTTPPLLIALAEAMTDTQRDRIRGVHYGGTHLTVAALKDLQTRWFPNAVHLSGYGNTLFGCCLELDASAGRTPTYFPHGDRLVFGIATEPVQGSPRAQLCFSRLDDTVLLINVAERDAGVLAAPPPDAPAGFHLPGVSDVGPIERPDQPARGLY